MTSEEAAARLEPDYGAFKKVEVVADPENRGVYGVRAWTDDGVHMDFLFTFDDDPEEVEFTAWPPRRRR